MAFVFYQICQSDKCNVTYLFQFSLSSGVVCCQTLKNKTLGLFVVTVKTERWLILKK